MNQTLLKRSMPLQPHATAAWLYDNTGLTYEQIADFCCIDYSVVEGIANGVIPVASLAVNPVADGYIDQNDIDACVADHRLRLTISKNHERFMEIVDSTKKTKYIPISKRKDKPNAIAWLLKNHPYLTDERIIKLVRTTKDTINAVRSKTHWNAKNIKIKDPVALGLCSKEDLEQAIMQCQIINARNGILEKIKQESDESGGDNCYDKCYATDSEDDVENNSCASNDDSDDAGSKRLNEHRQPR